LTTLVSAIEAMIGQDNPLIPIEDADILAGQEQRRLFQIRELLQQP